MVDGQSAPAARGQRPKSRNVKGKQGASRSQGGLGDVSLCLVLPYASAWCESGKSVGSGLWRKTHDVFFLGKKFVDNRYDLSYPQGRLMKALA